MNIFGIGLPEMIVIFVLALLIFGPKKLPEIGRSLGKTLRGFQEASKQFEAEIQQGINSPPPDSTPAPAAIPAATNPPVATPESATAAAPLAAEVEPTNGQVTSHVSNSDSQPST